MSTITERSRWSHEVHLRPLATSAGEARVFVSLHLVEHDLAYLVGDVQLVVSELVTNSVLHAETSITVMMRARPFGVMLTVHDGSLSTPVTTGTDLGATHGRGMRVVEEFSSDWGFSPGVDGKQVWASFALRPPLLTAS